MRSFWTTAALALVLAAPAGAQEADTSEPPGRVAELTKELASAPAEKRFLVLLDLTRALESSDLSRAFDYLRQARAASRTPEESLRADAREAALVIRKGDYAAALRIARPAADRARALGAGPAEFNALITLGDIYRLMSDFDAAVEAYESALEVGRRIGRTSSLAQAETGLGIVFLQLHDLTNAEAHLRRSLELTKSASSRLARAWALSTLGRLHYVREQDEEARRAYTEAMTLRHRAGSRGGEADAMTNLALLETRAKHYEEARRLLEAAIAIHVSLGQKSNEVLARLDLTNVVFLGGEPEKALRLLDEIRPLAESVGTPRVLRRFHERRGAFAEARGDFATALASLRAMNRLDAEATGEEARLKIAALQVRYDLARRDADLAKLEAHNAAQAAALQESAVAHARTRTRLVAYSAVFGVVATVTAAGLIILGVRRREDRRTLAATQAARRAAEEADVMKTRLLRVASHDLQAPLATLRTAATQIEQVAHDPAAVAGLSAIMGAEAGRMSGLVRDFLDATTIEMGKIELRLSSVDLGALAAEVVADQQGVAARKRQALTLQAPASPLAAVAGDPDRLRQALENVIGNALKFAPPEGRITVRPLIRADGVAVEVEDNGPGLAPEDFPRLFQPYARLSARPTGGEGSTGLGLNIAHELVRLHGGRIAVDSAPEAGATFTIVLPAAPATG